MTGTEEAPCSQCEENTFGYDPITGCQECKCMVEGTVAGKQFSINIRWIKTSSKPYLMINYRIAA